MLCQRLQFIFTDTIVFHDRYFRVFEHARNEQQGGNKVFDDGEDFRNWVKDTMGDIAPLTPDYLWAQRNAMLHVMTYKSRDTLKIGFYIVFDEAFKAPTAKEDEDGKLWVMISCQWLIGHDFAAADKFIIKSVANLKAQERAQGLYVKSTLNDLQRKGA
jgi:hypothetical protein